MRQKEPRNEPFELFGHEVLPGKTRRLEIPISTLSTGTVLSIPVVVAHGVYAGPKLLVSAAIHGDEINGIEIVRRVLELADPRRMHGTLVAVPVVNVFGYLTRSRYLPDRRDLNRSFPGSKKGSLASQLAHLFLTRVVEPCQFGIDLHTGSDNRVNMPQIRANLGHEATRELALAFGAPVVVQSRLRANSLRATVARRDMPMLVYEAGEALRFDEHSLSIGTRGVMNVMAHLGIQAAGHEEPSPNPFISEASSWIRSPRGGILHSKIALGDLIEEGEQLGRVSDIYGKIRARVVATYSGMVIGLSNNPMVSRGDAVFHVARNPEDPKSALPA